MNTDKKNQHYVPKFYLRNFSFENNRKQIGLFNLENECFIPKAKLKTQASKNFFYGRDGVIEDNLAGIEGRLSRLISGILVNNSLPRCNSQEHFDLLEFAVLTDMRTPTRLKQIQQINNELMKFSSDEIENGDLVEQLTLMSSEDILKMNINNVSRIAGDIKDLSYKLLINETPKPFITSDYPVVRYNQFLEERNHLPSNTGYGFVGLQIFIPLNSRITLILYDEGIYKIGHRQQKVVPISNLKDIEQLNILQFINCFSTVYFNHEVNEAYIKSLFNKSKSYERANNVLFKSGKVIDNQPIFSESYMESGDNFIFHNDKDCELNLDLSVIKVHSKGKRYKMTESEVQLRKSFKN
ncbi:DUF4238 domain-containing protein [Psychrobacter sp. FDAARGOS_221]|uniref:DUF4238 domain-containing protein n=1 Tax=Psychrobacter sp. FDAARGOS_221 TaxID=1975705 RepID=UPI00187D5F28|nr:DUF4238 domain-containing protein [Psychrobacter sp. FDAARGOS_221]